MPKFLIPIAIAIGFAILDRLFFSNTSVQSGLDPNDTGGVTRSLYGAVLGRTFGIARTEGVRVWAKPPSELSNLRGGKGIGAGKGPVQEIVNGQWVDALCSNEISIITRIWLNGELEFDLFSTDPDQVARNNELRGYLTVRNGTAVQTPLPLIEDDLGVGNVPGYAGVALAAWDGIPVDKFGNRYPSASYEVVSVLGYPESGFSGEFADEFEGLQEGNYTVRVRVRGRDAIVATEIAFGIAGPFRGLRLTQSPDLVGGTNGTLEIFSSTVGNIVITANSPRLGSSGNPLSPDASSPPEIIDAEFFLNGNTAQQGYALGPLNLEPTYQNFQNSRITITDIDPTDNNAQSGADLAVIIQQLLAVAGLNVSFSEIPDNVTPVIGFIHDTRSDILRIVSDLANQVGWLLVWNNREILIRPREGVKAVEIDANKITISDNAFSSLDFQDRNELVSKLEYQYLAFGTGHEQEVVSGLIVPKLVSVTESIQSKLTLTLIQARTIALLYSTRQYTANDTIRFVCTPDALRVADSDNPYLLPGDIVRIPGPMIGRSSGTAYTITDISVGANSTIDVTARRRGYGDSLFLNLQYDPPTITAFPPSSPSSISAEAIYLDLPNWHNNDNSGFYAYFGWQGFITPRPNTVAQLQRALAANLNPVDVATLTIAAISFTLLTPLSSSEPWIVCDTDFQISLADDNVQLFNVDEPSFLRFANLLVIGQELIAFNDVTLSSPGTYTISKSIRGLFSTFNENTNHIAGVRGFILRSSSAVTGITSGIDDLTDINVGRVARAITNGQDPSDATYTSATTTGRNIRAFPTSPYSAQRSGNGDLRIRWNPLVRNQPRSLGGGRLTNIEAIEEYQVSIGSRLEVVLDSTQYIYSLADQIADGLVGTEETIDVSINHYSAITGYSSPYPVTLRIEAVA